MPEKVVVSWSGGKDSALAIYEIQRRPEYDVVSLLTTVTGDYDRVSMQAYAGSCWSDRQNHCVCPLSR